MAAVGLDTSVVLRLLTGEPRAQFRRAVEFVNQGLDHGDQLVVSDLVVTETYFALHHHYGVPKQEAIAKLRDMFDGGEIISIGHSHAVLRTPKLATAKPGFVDRVIHAQYEASAAAFASFERAVRRLSGSIILR